MDGSVQKDWTRLRRQELLFLNGHRRASVSPFAKLEQAIPQKLQETLYTAFYKAFDSIFTHGSSWIDRTYPKAAFASAWQEHAGAAHTHGQTARRSFGRSASRSNRGNLLLTSLEGIGLGALGIGLPDIPLFTAVLLKSLYEIATHYGHEVDSLTERAFLLQLIHAALQDGPALKAANSAIDQWLEHPIPPISLQELTTTASHTLADRLLYGKFVQGIPVVGMAGGLENTVVLQRITTYARLKHQRRLLLSL